MFFGYGVGQQSWKQFLFPPRHRLWQARQEGSGFQILPPDEDAVKFAFIGVHACDLQAIAVQDQVFLEGPFIDPHYRARREQAFILAVNCGHPCGTGFCVSMGTGPRATSGFDLALTEILQGKQHYFLVAVGTEQGRQLIEQVPHRQAEAEEREAAARMLAQAAGQMGRTLDTTDLKALLYRNYENPRWDQVAARCLTCGNCTLVCPTCFCHTVEDATDLTGDPGRTLAALGRLLYRGFHLPARRQHPHYAPVPLPPVADPQTGHLDRPVRGLGLRGLRPLHHLVPGGHRHHRRSPGHPGERTDCRPGGKGVRGMETPEPILAAHPVFSRPGPPAPASIIGECASRVNFNAGQFLFREQDEAAHFYLINHGQVAVEIFRHRRGPITIQTLGEGEALGWLWFEKPYHWHYDARAVHLTRALALDVNSLTPKVRTGPRTGLRAHEKIRPYAGGAVPGDSPCNWWICMEIKL